MNMRNLFAEILLEEIQKSVKRIIMNKKSSTFWGFGT